jgi:hypothetical protein
MGIYLIARIGKTGLRLESTASREAELRISGIAITKGRSKSGMDDSQTENFLEGIEVAISV